MYDKGANTYCNNAGIMLRSEIDMMNKRLDAIDNHCKEFAKLAQEKSKLEDNLKNLAYFHMLDNKENPPNRLNESPLRPDKKDDNVSQPLGYQTMAPYETSIKD